jgi:predicted CoA-binding protein
MSETVLLIGASNNKARYSNKAMALLLEKGHTVVPVNPREATVMGVEAAATLDEVTLPVDTASVYLRPELLKTQLDSLIRLRPRRVILNPGTEDTEITSRLDENGIQVVEACTIVLLKTEQF